MSVVGPSRRLSAVLIADIQGYTKLVERDTDGTVAAWTSARSDVIDPEIAKHAGRIVKYTGDGFLAEFSNVQDAVECAIAMQTGLADSSLQFRMGVNLSDIVDDGTDIHGEGVNIAARIEALAEPGGISVSGSVYEQVRNRIAAAFEDFGEHDVKHVSAPVRVYRISSGTGPTIAEAERMEELALPDKPSIAVLPFDNMPGDPEQEFFSDGISEDIITALSKFGWFFVTARNSTFSYKGTSTDVKQIGVELGVRYVLEGSVRKAGNRVRVTGQLIDATTGNHLWAERYDREITDIFDLQDEITETVTATIAPQLLVAENERVKRKRPENMEAWELVMRFQPLFWRMNGADLLEAQNLLLEAIERDPDYALAHALLGFSYVWGAWMGWGKYPRHQLPLAEPAARRALELDDQEPWAHLAMSTANGYARRHDEAIAETRRALELNPNLSFAHAWLGILLGYAGHVELADESLDRTLRISPRDPFNAMLPVFRAIGYFTAGRDAEVCELTQGALRVRPDMLGAWRLYTISSAQLGNVEDARRGMDETKRLQPTITLEWAENFSPWVRAQDRERYLDAGLT